MSAEKWALGLHLAHDLAHGAGDVQACPLRVRACLAHAPPEPARAGELAGEHFHLLAQPRRTADVVELLCLVQLAAQLAEPRLVGTAGIGIEHLAGVPGAHVLGAAEIERMELSARVAEQLEEIRDALHVLEPGELALAGNAPDVAVATHPRDAAGRSGSRRRRSRDRGTRRPHRVRLEPLLQGDQPETCRRRRRLPLQRCGALAIATRTPRAQAAGQLALRVRALRNRAD